MNNQFVYDEIERKHTLNGKPIGSVSQIIAPLNDFSKIPPGKLERKRQLGIEFHEAIRLHLLDDLAFDDLDPDLVKPMNTFTEWWTGLRKIISIERPIYHKILKYCGQPDLVCDNAIYDWKLRGFMPAVDRLKLEAYRHMVSKTKLSLWTVCFTLEGKMTIHDSYHKQAWGIFRKMLERYNSELEFDNLMNNWKGVN
ncbi:MAG: hypothetical protein ACUZ8I_02025 [Candidatus Scalindua sp.]